MTCGFRRRDALAALAMLPALASTHEVFAAGRTRFDPPVEPMVFTRRLVRELGGGAAIDVLRDFAVRFVPQSSGYRVEGEQTSAHVDAPASLAAFAEIEQRRQETGLFPLQLDRDGTIVAGPGGAAPADMSEAVDAAFAWIARHRLSAADKTAARDFVMGLQTIASGLTSALPPDLFTGAPIPLERAQELTLPDGSPGHVLVSYGGVPNPATGLLQRAQRIVVTEAAGTVSRTIEEWTLDFAPPLERR